MTQYMIAGLAKKRGELAGEIAALIGMALSAVGVWLIKTTFEATRHANVIAQDMGERQIRAYIAVKPGQIKLAYGKISIEIELTNSGQSPARDVSVNITGFESEKIENRMDAKVIPLGDISAGANRKLTYESDAGKDMVSRAADERIKLAIAVAIVYETVFSREDIRETYRYHGRVGGGQEPFIVPVLKPGRQMSVTVRHQHGKAK